MTNFSVSAMEASRNTDKQEMYLVVVTCTLIAILITLTILGNTLVMVAFYLCKELRTITNYFLVSLSLADLMTALLAMPIFLASRVTSDGAMFPGGAVFYDVWRSMDILCGTASIWNLCLVSLDRFLAVASPLKHLVILTPTRAKGVIVLVWAASLGLSGILHVNWNHKGVFITIISFFLPLIMIIFSYAKIYQVTTRTCVLRRSGGMQLKRDIRSAKQMVLVIGVFILCWVGFFVFTLILSTKRSTSPSINPGVLDFVKSLTYLNSCINPLLFTMVSRTFKKAILDILRCRIPRIKQERCKLFGGRRKHFGSSLASSFSRQSSASFKRNSDAAGLCFRKTVTHIEKETCV